MEDEPDIIINGYKLTEAQAMAVRVAITVFHLEVGSEEGKRDLGAIGEAYRARLSEVLNFCNASKPAERLRGTVGWNKN